MVKKLDKAGRRETTLLVCAVLPSVRTRRAPLYAALELTPAVVARMRYLSALCARENLASLVSPDWPDIRWGEDIADLASVQWHVAGDEHSFCAFRQNGRPLFRTSPFHIGDLDCMSRSPVLWNPKPHELRRDDFDAHFNRYVQPLLEQAGLIPEGMALVPSDAEARRTMREMLLDLPAQPAPTATTRV